MAAHIAILPQGVIDTMTLQVNERLAQGEGTSSGIGFLRLPHPRTGISSLFMPSRTPDGKVAAIFELQNISPNASRSWFNEGEVISDGKLLFMTPVDPAFLLLPILRASIPRDGTVGNLRTMEDIFEEAGVKLSEASDEHATDGEASIPSQNDINELGGCQCVQYAMKRICEWKDITPDLAVYRFSQEKFMEYLAKKANRLRQASIVDSSRSLVRELAKDGLMEDGKETLLEAGRLKLACDMISQYLPPDVHQDLLRKFDFTALDAYVQALQDANMIVSNQQSAAANEAHKNEEQDGKKRKAVAQVSKGVEKLKKANIRGMAKLSTFFQKSAAKA